MSRFRSSADDLAYGDIPQRWDRERFERFGSRGGPLPGRRFEDDDDYDERERDRPARRDVAVAERVESRGPSGRWVFEEDREIDRRPTPPRRRRRTDRELFGDVDPHEIADMALMPYRRKSITREDFDIDQRGARPGLIRRQSSLDTFDRRRRHDEEYPIPPYTPVPLPIRRRREWEGYYEPEDYREVEIQRERSIHRRRPSKAVKKSVKSKSSSSSSSSSSTSEDVEIKTAKSKSRAPSTKAKSSRAPSVHESIHETYISEHLPPAPPPPAPAAETSVQETLLQESVHAERRFKKGKTRMPKRLVRVEAIMDLGYPFEEEDDFYVLQIALEKEQIDEVIRISETYKNADKKKIYRFEETVQEGLPIPAPPVGEHEEIQRTEWINPPTVIGRKGSPSAKSSISQVARSRSRRPSSPGVTYVEKRETIIEASAPPPPPPPAAPEIYEERKTIIEERSPSHHHHAGSLVLAEREYRSDRDIDAEIRHLEQERRALRLEREAEQKRDLALRLRGRPDEEFQLVEYRDRSRPRQELIVYERERSPPRNVVRVEKDRKGRMALVRSSH